MRPRWRGTILAAMCVAGFYAVFDGWLSIENAENRKIWLWVFVIGAIAGGAVSFIDSLRQFTSEKKRMLENRK